MAVLAVRIIIVLQYSSPAFPHLAHVSLATHTSVPSPYFWYLKQRRV